MTEPIVSIQNLKQAFGDHVVLDGINLNVMPGEKVVVLGPSGSGKSTMLRCINALEIPTSGAIFFNGIEEMCIRDRLKVARFVFTLLGERQRASFRLRIQFAHSPHHPKEPP